MEGGDSRELGSMMHQLGQDEAVSDPAFGEVTERLMKGEDPERIESDLGGAHGLNERIRVQSVYDGRDFLYELVKEYADNAAALP